MAEAQKKSHGFVGRATKKALAPVAHAAVTAGTAYLTRKALQVWEERVQPKIQEKGGGRAVAKETLETVAEKAGPVAEPVSSLAEKVSGEASGQKSSQKSSSSREAERRERSQRREQRRRALQKSSSS